MTVSRARRKFRVFLGFMLVFAFGVNLLMVGLYIAVRNKVIHFQTLAPTLFQIDVYQHHAKAAFSDTEDRHKIASELIRKGLFSAIYSDAGVIMMKELADEGYAPSQTAHASILMYQGEKNRPEALEYYTAAAAQGYPPAQQAISEINNPAALPPK